MQIRQTFALDVIEPTKNSRVRPNPASPEPKNIKKMFFLSWSQKYGKLYYVLDFPANFIKLPVNLSIICSSLISSSSEESNPIDGLFKSLSTLLFCLSAASSNFSSGVMTTEKIHLFSSI